MSKKARLPWLKMWVEWQHDPKMLTLSLAETGAWWKLVTLAQECDAAGRLIKGNGTPLSLREIAQCVHITSKADTQVLQAMVAKMESQGSLSWVQDTLTLLHFAVRQELTASATKEAVRDRVRAYRERQVTETPLQRESNKEKIVLEKEKERESTGTGTSTEGESNGVTPVTRNGSPVTPDSLLAKITNLYKTNVGQVAPSLVRSFDKFLENFSGQAAWIDDAFAEAVAHDVKTWAYVRAILLRWQKEGRQGDGRNDPRTGGRAGAPRRDSSEDDREAGWHDKD